MKNRLVLFSCIILILGLISVLAVDDVTILSSTDSGNVPLSVDFSINSSLNILTYKWDLDNDGKIDSTDKEPSFNYNKDGTYIVTLTVTTQDNQTLSVIKKIIVKTTMTASVTATPSTGVAPLTVQFTAAATGKEPLTYSWDFNGDGTIDSTQQNPLKTFDNAGEYQVSLKVTDATENWQSKITPITVTNFDSKLTLNSYFPTTVNPGENQITFIIYNNGTEVVKDISAKVVGTGIQYLSSTGISSLKGGDQDSLTTKINVLQSSGSIAAIVKVLDKSFPINLTITEQVKYNKDELSAKLEESKKKLDEQEKIYYDKKAQGFLVNEMFDSIKSAKNKLQETQQQLLTNKLADAKVNLDLIDTSLIDITQNLKDVKQQEQTFLMWIKDNAVAIAAIIAALGTIGGFVIKASSKVKTHATQLGESVKQKINAKKNHESESKKEESKEEKAADKKEDAKEKKTEEKEESDKKE